MGLQSAMTTALTGLQGAETIIDVVGNNVANSGTTGFKESDVLFATQFLQTQSIGSAPSADRGGTNPRQIGLGVKVAAINPNFNQGTIEISANPLDMAIQGDGFLIVRGEGGNLYTRNGQIQLNRDNELVTVTGNRLLGFAVGDDFEIINSGEELVPLRIPFGEAPVSQITTTASLQGVLTPDADEGNQASIIASDILGDAAFVFPDDPSFNTGDFQLVNTPPGTPIGQGNYSYYVAFTDGGTMVSRPSMAIGPITVGPNQQIQISNIPQPPGGSGFTGINIYRNLAGNSSAFHLLNTTPLALGTTTFTDDLADTAIDTNPTIDRMGVKAGNGTRLINVLVRDGDTYSRPFEPMGELSFEGRRGDRTLGAKVLQIGASTTVQDLIVFMEDSFGLTNEDIDYANLPYALPEADGTIGTDGVIRFTSNAGITNALGVTQSSFELTPNGIDTPIPIDLPFTETQPAHGEGSLTDFVVYDSLGTALNVRVSTVLEEKGDTFTRYRWFATSDDNEPADGLSTFVGTGTIVFDSRGNIETGGTGEINIQRNQSAAASPLTVELDFSRVSGRGSDASMRMTGQDGFAPGTLSSFIITESGLIRGIFSNGAERPLGQIRMARFPNNVGLQQIGENLFAGGINSGTALIDDPGANGIGTLTSGALELSNTDIGQNLIELILASTQYRGGARVITTAQQLLDELLNLRR